MGKGNISVSKFKLKKVSKALKAIQGLMVEPSGHGKRGRSTERTKRGAPPAKHSKPADARLRLEAQKAKITKKLKVIKAAEDASVNDSEEFAEAPGEGTPLLKGVTTCTCCPDLECWYIQNGARPDDEPTAHRPRFKYSSPLDSDFAR